MNSKGSFYKQFSKYTKAKPAPVLLFQHTEPKPGKPSQQQTSSQILKKCYWPSVS